MKRVIFCLAAGLVGLDGAAWAKVLVVNTTNNILPGPGETNLVQVLGLVQDGDTIQFNLPGPGPFYLVTPPLSPQNGYPAITAHNVTIDGYTQPGARPNTAPILSANNARIQIVLDSRAGGGHSEVPGLSSVFLVKGATNLTLRGLCFLGPGISPYNHAVTFAVGAHGGHIQGCWIGVDLDGRSVYRFTDGVAALEYPSGLYVNNTVIGVEKSAPNTATARSQFNVIVGPYIPIILEGQGCRISGNFLNVLPDGLTDYNGDGSPGHELQAALEIGRLGNNVVIGTDGDGVNDAEERNVFGGVTVADDGEIIEFYGNARQNVVIAGNYFGVGVDGRTRFTNSMKLFALENSVGVRIGSDMNGVSDSLEGNVICMNYPFDTLFPAPSVPGPPPFASLPASGWVSLRGNQLVGNNIPPFSFADGTGYYLNAFTNYFAPFMDTAQVVPTLASNSSQAYLIGTCATGVAPYTNVVIDLYLADDEGWTNGQKFQLSELAALDPVTQAVRYDGFAQGQSYLGSFVDNGPQDLDPTPGRFAFTIAGLHLNSPSRVTITANYLADPPGTANGRAHTSAFARPVALQTAPTLTASACSLGVLLSWATNGGLGTLQCSGSLRPCNWTNMAPQPVISISGANYQAVVPVQGRAGFFRLVH